MTTPLRLPGSGPQGSRVMSNAIESVRTVYERWTRFLVATVRGRDGTKLERVILDHGLSATVLPYDPERRVAMLVVQARVPVIYTGEHGEILEAIAGRVEQERSEERRVG